MRNGDGRYETAQNSSHTLCAKAALHRLLCLPARALHPACVACALGALCAATCALPACCSLRSPCTARVDLPTHSTPDDGLHNGSRCATLCAQIKYRLKTCRRTRSPLLLQETVLPRCSLMHKPDLRCKPKPALCATCPAHACDLCALHTPAPHDHAARLVHPTHAPSPSPPHICTARPCAPSVAPQFSSSVAGEKHAQNKPRREKRAQNLQASPTEVSPRPSLFSGALLPVTLTACGLRRR